MELLLWWNQVFSFETSGVEIMSSGTITFKSLVPFPFRISYHSY